MMELFNLTTFKCSEIVTKSYSTSFSLGIRMFDRKLHAPIYGIYGFVRYADEIVDTFHGYNKKRLLDDFKKDTFQAIEDKISLNPILHSFQIVVNKYNIEHELITAFLHSMEMDLYFNEYNQTHYEEYIYGSAEVVGLMCLRVFCEGNEEAYQRLKPAARSLGSAFQKVNFLRDMKSDYFERGRTYFPNVDFKRFDYQAKKEIEADIQRDFDHAYTGILQLPKSARLGVYLAYIYYLKLFRKIQETAPTKVMNERIRVPDTKKFTLLVKSYVKHQLNYI
ncbi:MAG: phytoene/squalene synthase family protein [Thermoflexibacter sp.]|uniref:Phytoene/squalene synthetase n=1 Tax=Thermoflexibacter ruber TaxID=1003 RepID=A0A1I2HU35_9BACT|nr:phytoene/squalene synthase family protein [Thermoflexibacter ruber]SFF32913.1 Phytoene/squalene synthetase [Thermoflexibacter ruber]